MYRFLFFLAFGAIFCKQSNQIPLSAISFAVSNLTPADTCIYETGSLKFLLDTSYVKYQGLTIKNNLYDTIFIPVSNTLIGSGCPFISYDKIEYYENDSTKTTDLIFTDTGYDIMLPQYDSIKVFLYSRNKRKRYKFYINMKIDSGSTCGIRIFSFSN